jgi:hypothetical protein
MIQTTHLKKLKNLRKEKKEKKKKMMKKEMMKKMVKMGKKLMAMGNKEKKTRCHLSIYKYVVNILKTSPSSLKILALDIITLLKIVQKNT